MAYVVLAVYPLISMLTPEPIQFRWWLRTGGKQMPKSLLEKSIRNEALHLIVKFLLVMAGTCVLATFFIPLAPKDLGFTVKQPTLVLIVAPIVCMFELLWVRKMRHLGDTPSANLDENVPLLFLRQRWWVILLVILVGAFAEEFWRSASLIALKQAGHSVSGAVILTSIVFGLGHLQSPQAMAMASRRIFRPAIGGLLFAGLFLWSGTLVLPFLAHVSLNSLAALVGRKKILSVSNVSTSDLARC